MHREGGKTVVVEDAEKVTVTLAISESMKEIESAESKVALHDNGYVQAE